MKGIFLFQDWLQDPTLLSFVVLSYSPQIFGCSLLSVFGLSWPWHLSWVLVICFLELLSIRVICYILLIRLRLCICGITSQCHRSDIVFSQYMLSYWFALLLVISILLTWLRSVCCFFPLQNDYFLINILQEILLVFANILFLFELPPLIVASIGRFLHATVITVVLIMIFVLNVVSQQAFSQWF